MSSSIEEDMMSSSIEEDMMSSEGSTTSSEESTRLVNIDPRWCVPEMQDRFLGPTN